MSFIRDAAAYRRRHVAGRMHAAAVSWIPVGAGLAAPVLFLAVRAGYGGFALAAAILIVPPIAAAMTAGLMHREVSGALSWLDRACGGRQQLQAAWEMRESGAVLADAVRAAGEAFLKECGARPPVPRPAPARNLLAMAFLAGFFLLAAPVSRLADPDPALAARGEELQSWAEIWAEGSEGGGASENRDLADRMESLGRRMAGGALGENGAERALRRLEEDIEERRDELLRDRLAESLVDDLDMDRESAEAFRVGKRRLPADILSELGSRAGRSPYLSPADRERLEELLSDPALRDRTGRGTPELSHRLTETLEDVLDPEDPRLRELDEAAGKSRAARKSDRESGDAEGSGDGEVRPPGDGAAPAGDARGPGDSSSETEEDEAARSGVSGGSGRGSVPVEDEAAGTLPPAAPKEENPLRLPSGSDGSGSWRTVIRAYGDSGDVKATPDSGASPSWEKDVEAVMGREDLPPALKEYVRDYFLALEAGIGSPGGTEAAETGSDSPAGDRRDADDANENGPEKAGVPPAGGEQEE